MSFKKPISTRSKYKKKRKIKKNISMINCCQIRQNALKDYEKIIEEGEQQAFKKQANIKFVKRTNN